MIADILKLSSLVIVISNCTGCGRSGPNEVWSTKNEPMLGAADSSATIAVESLPQVTDPAALRQQALALLLKTADSTNPMLRANAIEALHYAPDQLGPILQSALGDANRGVRFVAAMSVGELKLKKLAPLLEPLLHDESQSVQAAAIYGLRRCGRRVDLNPLAQMLRSDDPEVKGNAALVLGELGEPTAISMLRQSVGRGMRLAAPARRRVVELQLAEAMVKLGAHNQIDVIRAALFATADEGEFVVLACQMCGELQDGGVLQDLINMVNRSGKMKRPPEIRLAAVQAIAEIDPSRVPGDLAQAYSGSQYADLRAQAAHALGAMGRPRGASSGNPAAVLPYLARLLEDESPAVQIAAAGAILRVGRAA